MDIPFLLMFLMSSLITNFSSVREFKKNSWLMYKSTNCFSRAEIILFLRTLLTLADVHQCNKVDFLIFCLCAAAWAPFIPCPLLPLHLELTLLRVKDLFAHTLGFPRQASLRDRSPESSEPFVTLGSCVYTPFISVYRPDTQSRTISEFCNSFFPSPHLRVSRTLRVWGFLEEFCPTDTPCRETRQHAPPFTLKSENMVKSFGTNSCTNCNTIQNSVFHLQ